MSSVQRSPSPLRSLATRAENQQHSQSTGAAAAAFADATAQPVVTSRGFLGRIADRAVQLITRSQPSSSAAAPAAAVAPPRAQDVTLAQQARIYVPVAEMIARQIAYDEADALHQEWTLSAPSFDPQNCQDWRTMYTEGRPQLSRVLVDAFTESAREEEFICTGAPIEATPVESTLKGRWLGSGPPHLIEDCYSAARTPAQLECAVAPPAAAPADEASANPADDWVFVESEEEVIDFTHSPASAAASSAPRRDESFRMIWGRIVQHHDLNPNAANETSCFIGFRGTYNGDGWAADFYTPSDGGLHPGEMRFHQLVKSKHLFENPLRHALSESQRTGKKARILITGHSLGGSDCERYAALFCHLVSRIAADDPSIRDHLAGITVIPFNSPGTHSIYGELFRAAAEALNGYGIEVACVDMKQHSDTVQKASSSRISLGAPDCSAIVKMRNARLGLWHIDPMTIQGHGRKFKVVKAPLPGELSALDRAQGSQISHEGRLYYRVLNGVKGVVTTVAKLVLDRPGLMTTPGYRSDEEIRQGAQATAEELAPRWIRAEVADRVVARALAEATEGAERRVSRGIV
jgi:hypothetical protein